MSPAIPTHVAAAARDALKRVVYLAALDPGEFDRLAQACDLRLLRRGDVAFVQDEPPPGVVVIVSGRIKVSRLAADGREQVLHEEGAGATLAEIPVFDGGGCVGTGTAVEDTAVIVVPRALLVDALGRSPAAARAVIRILAARIRRFAATIEDLSLRSVLERLASFLLREHQRTGDVALDLGATREELAAHLGTVREEVSRALSHLKRAGAIEVHGRSVRLLDADRLRALADGG